MTKQATRQDAVVGIARRAIKILDGCIRLAEKPGKIPRRMIAARLRRLGREVVRTKQFNTHTTWLIMSKINRLVRKLER